MTIAVLMSTYNGEKYLSEQLKSLADQTMRDSICVYIRNDGSTDGTFEIIEKWSKKVSIVLIKGENKGPAGSFWELLMNPDIQADYYAFCDQDDIWDADKLERGIALLRDRVHLSLCNCRLVDGEGNIIQERMYEEVPRPGILRQFVCGMAQGCAMVFTRELRDYFLDHPVKYVPMHDTVVALHAMGFGDIVWETEPKFGYRMHDSNVVAKENKPLLKRIKTTWWNWKNGSKNSMAEVAAELLDKPLTLTEEERIFLNHVKNYRTSLKSKVYILRNAYTESIPWRAVRSYWLRVILNLY